MRGSSGAPGTTHVSPTSTSNMQSKCGAAETTGATWQDACCPVPSLLDESPPWLIHCRSFVEAFVEETCRIEVWSEGQGLARGFFVSECAEAQEPSLVGEGVAVRLLEGE